MPLFPFRPGIKYHRSEERRGVMEARSRIRLEMLALVLAASCGTRALTKDGGSVDGNGSGAGGATGSSPAGAGGAGPGSTGSGTGVAGQPGAGGGGAAGVAGPGGRGGGFGGAGG
jgi:hypothetical protein